MSLSTSTTFLSRVQMRGAPQNTVAGVITPRGGWIPSQKVEMPVHGSVCVVLGLLDRPSWTSSLKEKVKA